MLKLMITNILNKSFSHFGKKLISFLYSKKGEKAGVICLLRLASVLKCKSVYILKHLQFTHIVSLLMEQEESQAHRLSEIAVNPFMKDLTRKGSGWGQLSFLAE